MFLNKTVVEFSHQLAETVVHSGDVVVDATVGNGNDTLFLAGLVGNEGKVYGFDIQQTAIMNTQRLLIQKNVNERVILVEDSHAHLDRYSIEPASLILFNLGYLPGGDKSIVTLPDSTVKAVKHGLKILKHNGMLLIVSYGHSIGIQEREYLEYYLESLPMPYVVSKIGLVNRPDNPPVLYCIER